MKAAGIILIVLGALALAYQGITYQSEERIAQIGPIEATAQREKTVPIPPIVGTVLLVAGVGLLIAGARRR